MPTYDYECDACGHAFELYQGINAPVETNCPSCKKKKLRRLIGTGSAIVFKGSGFYQTDYRSEGYKKAAESDSKSKSSPDSGDKKSTEGKTESKSDTTSSDSATTPTAKSETPSPPKGKKKPSE